MTMAPIADVESKLSAYIESSKQSPVVVTQNGKPIAFITAINDEVNMDRWFDLYSQYTPQYAKSPEQMLDEIVAEIKTLPPSQITPHTRTGPPGQLFRASTGVVVDPAEWDKQWAALETEMRQMQANDTQKTLNEMRDALSA